MGEQSSGDRAVNEAIGMQNRNPWKPCLPCSEFWACSLKSNVAEGQETPSLGVMKHKYSCLKKTDQYWGGRAGAMDKLGVWD